MGSDTNLITTGAIDNVDDDINAMTAKLQDHVLLHYSEVHGNWAQRLTAVFGAFGFRISRRRITVKVDGAFYDLPADVSITGPPLTPKITQQPQDRTSHADEGESQPPVTYNVTATGLLPLTFRWQIYDIALQQFVNVSVGQQKFGFSGTKVTVDQITNLPTSSSMILNSNSPGEGTYDPATFVRVIVDNTAVDGGIAISNPPTPSRPTGGAKLRMKDETCGCCFIFLACLNGDVPLYIQLAAKADYYTPERKRGYRWMCSWLIPLMDQKKALMHAVNNTIVRPFLWYGSWLYEKKKPWAMLLAPWCHAWLALWWFIGVLLKKDIDPPTRMKDPELRKLKSKGGS